MLDDVTLQHLLVALMLHRDKVAESDNQGRVYSEYNSSSQNLLSKNEVINSKTPNNSNGTRLNLQW